MATRNVVLTDSQMELIDRLVASGRYQNASEAMRAGLRLLEREEATVAAVVERLQRGVDQALTGQIAPGSGAEAVRRAFTKAASDR